MSSTQQTPHPSCVRPAVTARAARSAAAWRLSDTIGRRRGFPPRRGVAFTDCGPIRDTLLRFDRARRYAGLTGALLRAGLGEAKAPLKLTLCLTFRCNHRCAACGIWSRDDGPEMDADQLDRLLASVPGLRWLDLTGGEILMRADLPSIARSVHARLPALALLHFPSNGLRTSALLEATRLFVRRGGPKVIVTVSVDGPPDVHDRLRGCEGAFAAAVESIRQLRALPGAEVYAGLTLQPGNLDLVDATVAALDRALGGYRHADLHVNVQHRSTHYFANSAIPPVDADRARAALDSLRERKGPPHDPVTAIEWTFLRLAGAHSRSGRSPVPCRSGDLSAYVAPEGTVYACTIDPRPIAHLENFGWDLDRLWQSRQRASLRAEIREDRCVGCWTPCEAYQTLLGSPGKTLKGLLGSLRA